MDNSQGNKRIALNTIFLYIRMIFILIISLYTSRVILRTLGVEDYGIYNVVAGFVSMFAFLNTSMSNGIQRFYNFTIGKGDYNSISKVYTTAFLIQVLITILMLVLVETVGLWYINTKMVIPIERFSAAQILFQLTVVSMVILMIQIPYSAIIMAYEKMNYYALVGVIDVVLKLGVVLVLPLFNADKLALYGVLLLMVSFIDFLLYYVYAKKHCPQLRLERKIDKKLFNSMFGFSGWNIFGTFAFMMKNQGLNMVLNFFFGPIVNAARGISAQIMSALQGFSSNIVVAFRPQLVQSYASGNYSRVRNIFFSESKITYLMLYAMTVPVALDIQYILNLWLGKDMVPDHTITFTILVLMNMLVSSFHTPITQVVHASGKMKTYQIVISLIICSIIPISWAFLKFGYPPESVFWVSLVLTAINVLVSLIIVHSIFDFRYIDYLKKVILPCFFVSIFAPVLPIGAFLLMTPSFYRLIVICFLDVFMVCLFSYYLAFDKTEKDMVHILIHKFIKIRNIND